MFIFNGVGGEYCGGQWGGGRGGEKLTNVVLYDTLEPNTQSSSKVRFYVEKVD